MADQTGSSFKKKALSALAVRSLAATAALIYFGPDSAKAYCANYIDWFGGCCYCVGDSDSTGNCRAWNCYDCDFGPGACS